MKLGGNLRKFIAKSFPKKIRHFIPMALAQHLYFGGSFPIYWKNKRIGFLISHSSLIENKIYWRGIKKSDEGKSLEIFLDYVQALKPKLILDIGANTGVYGVLSKLVNLESEIHFFDPIIGCVNAIDLNLKLNGVEGINNHVALSNYNGFGEIYMNKNAEINYTVTLNTNREPDNSQYVKVQTLVQTYASYAESKGIGIPDLVKIDVETHEYEVLLGFGTFLSPGTSFLIEVLSDEAGSKLEKLLPNDIYDYWNIDDRKRQISKQNHLAKSFYYNFFVCPPEVSKRLGLSHSR